MPRKFFSCATLTALLLGATSVGTAKADQTTGGAEEATAREDTDPGEESSEPSDPDSQVWTEQIVVTANRTDRRAKDIPLNTGVLTEQEVLTAPESGIGDIVRQIPSLNLHGDQSTMVAIPRDQSLNFRGVSGSNVSHGLLLVDGMPLLDPYNASASWTKVAKDWVERVEVVAGGGANSWGNLALSGVVNLITHAPKDGRFAANARGGSKSTQDLSLSYSDIADSWAGWVGVDYFDTDGYYPVPEENRGSIDEPAAKQYQSLTGRGSYTLSPSGIVYFGGLVYAEERQEGTPLEGGTNDEYSLTVALDHTGNKGGVWQARLFGRDLTHEDFNADNADDHNSQEIRSIITDLSSPSGGLGGVWTLPERGKHSLTSGADIVLSSIDRVEDLGWTGEAFTRRSEVQGKQALAGVFIEDKYSVTDRLGLQLAGRFDAIRTYDGQSRQTDLATSETVQDDELGDNTETTFNPSLGFVFAASTASRFRGATYTGFRSPMPSELFVGASSTRTRVRVPNPNLEPETLVGAELGYDYTPSSTLNARLTGFWSETRNLIQVITVDRAGPGGEVIEPCGEVPPGARCQQRQNLGRTRAYGAEISGDYRPLPSWGFAFATTLLRAVVAENPDEPELVGNRISSTPEARYLLSASYLDDRLIDVFLRYRYIGDKFDDVENEDYLPSYQVVDLSLSRGLGKHWSIYGGVENLFDEAFIVTYSTTSGPILGPPRLFHVGFRYSNR